MDRLCDEIIQLIFNELDRPANFAFTCKRYYQLSQDPYVRAHYFLSRYGNIQAFFFALGRGRLLNERVIDILLSSGAHLSRYLVQCAIHHRFRTSVSFVKSPWVRTTPLATFAYFLKVAADRLGDIPASKGEDDGTTFASFIHESRLPPNLRPTKWETVMEIFEKYKFIPFSPKDPLMAQFPLALSIEPRLLPPAVANGFHMDDKYRDFIFRKMFEKSSSGRNKVEDILHNVRQLSLLDPSMFVSRTVAAEICMEAQSNEPAYKALKALDRKGHLKFELPSVVEELIKLFANTRSVTTTSTGNALRHLFTDFPSKDPTVRVVIILIALFCARSGPSPAQLHGLFTSHKLTPLCRRDVLNVLLNPFVEQFWPLFKYAKMHVEDLGGHEELMEEVITKALAITCKGNMLADILKKQPTAEKIVSAAVMKHYQVTLNSLPDREDSEKPFVAPLCRDFSNCILAVDSTQVHPQVDEQGDEEDEEDELMDDEDERQDTEGNAPSGPVLEPQTVDNGLGHIGQETLSYMIRLDELVIPRRRRVPYRFSHLNYDYSSRLRYPADHVTVGRWIRTQFGPHHPVTTVFMSNAVVNDNYSILVHYLNDAERVATSVPVTLRHFQLLARLRRPPSFLLFQAIKTGASFYASEDDFLSPDVKVKKENTPSAEVVPSTSTSTASTSASAPSDSSSPLSSPPSSLPSSPLRSSTSNKRPKRPRRSAASAVKSYVVPDSDDEAIAEELSDANLEPSSSSKATAAASGKRAVETGLQKWIRHLTELQKDEMKKYNDEKKRIHKQTTSGPKQRVPKSEFLKALSSGLRDLRQVESTTRSELGISDPYEQNVSDADDDEEYQARSRPAKKRKVVHASD